MTDVVICEPVRSPVGRFGGALASLSATDLAAAVLSELVRRTGLREGDVDDVVLGQCYPNGESPAIGRIAALDAGLGTSVPGLQIDRRCGSGLQAVLYAAGPEASLNRVDVQVQLRADDEWTDRRLWTGGISLNEGSVGPHVGTGRDSLARQVSNFLRDQAEEGTA